MSQGGRMADQDIKNIADIATLVERVEGVVKRQEDNERDQRDRWDKLTSRIDTFIDAFKDHLRDSADRVRRIDDHENRLRTLELDKQERDRRRLEKQAGETWLAGTWHKVVAVVAFL